MKTFLLWLAFFVWLTGIVAAVVLICCGFEPLLSSLVAVGGLAIAKIALGISDLMKEKV